MRDGSNQLSVMSNQPEDDRVLTPAGPEAFALLHEAARTLIVEAARIEDEGLVATSRLHEARRLLDRAMEAR